MSNPTAEASSNPESACFDTIRKLRMQQLTEELELWKTVDFNHPKTQSAMMKHFDMKSFVELELPHLPRKANGGEVVKELCPSIQNIVASNLVPLAVDVITPAPSAPNTFVIGSAVFASDTLKPESPTTSAVIDYENTVSSFDIVDNDSVSSDKSVTLRNTISSPEASVPTSTESIMDVNHSTPVEVVSKSVPSKIKKVTFQSAPPIVEQVLKETISCAPGASDPGSKVSVNGLVSNAPKEVSSKSTSLAVDTASPKSTPTTPTKSISYQLNPNAPAFHPSHLVKAPGSHSVLGNGSQNIKQQKSSECKEKSTRNGYYYTVRKGYSKQYVVNSDPQNILRLQRPFNIPNDVEYQTYGTYENGYRSEPIPGIDIPFGEVSTSVVVKGNTDNELTQSMPKSSSLLDPNEDLVKESTSNAAVETEDSSVPTKENGEAKNQPKTIVPKSSSPLVPAKDTIEEATGVLETEDATVPTDGSVETPDEPKTKKNKKRQKAEPIDVYLNSMGAVSAKINPREGTLNIEESVYVKENQGLEANGTTVIGPSENIEPLGDKVHPSETGTKPYGEENLTIENITDAQNHLCTASVENSTVRTIESLQSIVENGIFSKNEKISQNEISPKGPANPPVHQNTASRPKTSVNEKTHREQKTPEIRESTKKADAPWLNKKVHDSTPPKPIRHNPPKPKQIDEDGFTMVTKGARVVTVPEKKNFRKFEELPKKIPSKDKVPSMSSTPSTSSKNQVEKDGKKKMEEVKLQKGTKQAKSLSGEKKTNKTENIEEKEERCNQEVEKAEKEKNAEKARKKAAKKSARSSHSFNADAPYPDDVLVNESTESNSESSSGPVVSNKDQADRNNARNAEEETSGSPKLEAKPELGEADTIGVPQAVGTDNEELSGSALPEGEDDGANKSEAKKNEKSEPSQNSEPEPNPEMKEDDPAPEYEVQYVVNLDVLSNRLQRAKNVLPRAHLQVIFKRIEVFSRKPLKKDDHMREFVRPLENGPEATRARETANRLFFCERFPSIEQTASSYQRLLIEVYGNFFTVSQDTVMNNVAWLAYSFRTKSREEFLEDERKFMTTLFAKDHLLKSYFKI